MSTNLNYKQVANVSRRTWDTETYEKRAAARQQETDGDGAKKRSDQTAATDDTDKPEFQAADQHAAGPEGSERAFLKARREKVSDIDNLVGTTELVSTEKAATTSTEEGGITAGVVKSGIGWHCKVCDCFLKDSLTYLDHINGRKHQRKLGFTMRVERTTKDSLMAKLSQLTKKKEEASKKTDAVEELNYGDIVKAKDEEAERRKEERIQKRKERKQRAAEPQDDDDEEGEAEIDPAMAAMMGFGGFGGSKK